jgi:hypothetical protein
MKKNIYVVKLSSELNEDWKVRKPNPKSYMYVAGIGFQELKLPKRLPRKKKKKSYKFNKLI